MRKFKLITGTISLSLAVVVAATSFIQISSIVEDNNNKKYASVDTTTEVATTDSNIIVEAVKTNIVLEAAPQLEQETTENASVENKTKSDSKKTTKEVKKQKKKKSSKKNKKDTKLEYMGNYKVTAYCGCVACCGKSNCITASGIKAKEGRTIAADTSVLPFGTKVVIDGHTYTVEDRGGAIDGNRIDVYFKSHKDALQWGVRYIDVYAKR